MANRNNSRGIEFDQGKPYKRYCCVSDPVHSSASAESFKFAKDSMNNCKFQTIFFDFLKSFKANFAYCSKA